MCGRCASLKLFPWSNDRRDREMVPLYRVSKNMYTYTLLAYVMVTCVDIFGHSVYELHGVCRGVRGTKSRISVTG